MPTSNFELVTYTINWRVDSIGTQIRIVCMNALVPASDSRLLVAGEKIAYSPSPPFLEICALH